MNEVLKPAIKPILTWFYLFPLVRKVTATKAWHLLALIIALCAGWQVELFKLLKQLDLLRESRDDHLCDSFQFAQLLILRLTIPHSEDIFRLNTVKGSIWTVFNLNTYRVVRAIFINPNLRSKQYDDMIKIGELSV